ncbi:hypothetical protein MRX96_052107 [Rhipicephalus microplus]
MDSTPKNRYLHVRVCRVIRHNACVRAFAFQRRQSRAVHPLCSNESLRLAKETTPVLSWQRRLPVRSAAIGGNGQVIYSSRRVLGLIDTAKSAQCVGKIVNWDTQHSQLYLLFFILSRIQSL